MSISPAVADAGQPVTKTAIVRNFGHKSNDQGENQLAEVNELGDPDVNNNLAYGELRLGALGLIDMGRKAKESYTNLYSGGAPAPPDVCGHSVCYNKRYVDASILLTKLFIPSVPPSIIHRQHLIERLTAGLKAGRSLTLVSAPAGYGKSTLLSEWITAYKGQVGWLSLDERDNNPLRFWTYFVTSIQTASKPFGQELLQRLESAQDFDAQLLLTGLVNQAAACEHPVILVLDDYHAISSSDIHAGMNFLVEHLPPALHLVIATRTDPPLPLSRLRVRGQMTEVRIADLRFNRDESWLFLNDLMNLGLTASDVQALETRTEGWIAGLQLAALSMQGRADTHAFIKNFTGSQHFVLEYLVEEVLQR